MPLCVRDPSLSDSRRLVALIPVIAAITLPPKMTRGE